MASPENIQLQVTVDGGAQQTGAVTVAAGDVIVASLADPSGVKRAVYKIWEYPDGFTVPAGWTEESSGKYSVTTLNGAAAPAFTLGSDWGKYFLSVEVNGRTRDGAVADDLYDESTFLEMPSATGIKDTGFGETNQADSHRQWAGAMKDNWRILDGFLTDPFSLPIQMAHGDTLVRGRNFADTADVGLFAWGTVDNDEILIGNASHVAFVTVLMKATAEFGIYADGAARFVVSVAGAVQAESATAPTVNAGQGGWWVENTAPSRPMFKDDVGNSYPLGPYEAENALTGAANTLSLAAVGKRTTVSHGSSTQLTVPPNSGVAFPVGILLNIVQIGAGTVEIVQGSGVTVHPQPGSTLFLAGQWASVQLWQQSADVWVLTGGLA